VLELGPFGLESVVILLENSDQLFEIVDLFAVSELHLFSVNSEVGGDIGHVSEDLVLGHEVLDGILKVVDVFLEFTNLCILLVHHVVDLSHPLLDIHVEAAKLVVLILLKHQDLLLELFILFFEMSNLLASGFRLLFLGLEALLGLSQLLSLFFHCSVNLLLDECLEAIETLLGVLELFDASISFFDGGQV